MVWNFWSGEKMWFKYEKLIKMWCFEPKNKNMLFLCAKLFYTSMHILRGSKMVCEKGSLHLIWVHLSLDSWIDETPLSWIERSSPGRVITSSWFNQWCKRVSKRTSLSRMYRFEKPWVNLIGSGNNFKLV